jgi:hypothetical protein
LLIGVILDNNIMWLSVFFIHTVKLAYDVSKLTNNDKVPLYDNYMVSDTLKDLLYVSPPTVSNTAS